MVKILQRFGDHLCSHVQVYDAIARLLFQYSRFKLCESNRRCSVKPSAWQKKKTFLLHRNDILKVKRLPVPSSPR